MTTTAADAAAPTCQGQTATIVGSGRAIRGTEGRDVVVTNGATSVSTLGAGHPRSAGHRPSRDRSVTRPA